MNFWEQILSDILVPKDSCLSAFEIRDRDTLSPLVLHFQAEFAVTTASLFLLLRLSFMFAFCVCNLPFLLFYVNQLSFIHPKSSFQITLAQFIFNSNKRNRIQLIFSSLFYIIWVWIYWIQSPFNVFCGNKWIS